MGRGAATEHPAAQSAQLSAFIMSLGELGRSVGAAKATICEWAEVVTCESCVSGFDAGVLT